MRSNVVLCEELKNYIEEYLSEYTRFVDENYGLLSFPQSYLSNFTFFLHPPSEIEGVISRTHGAAIFFNFPDRENRQITIKEISDSIEYYIWPEMPRNTSALPWVLIKHGDYHLDTQVNISHGLLFVEPGANLRYTGKENAFNISGNGAIVIFGSLVYEDRMILKGTNSKEGWSKIQARFDALSDFVWDCEGVLNATTIERINAKYKLPLLLDKIAFRMESGRYWDNPSLFTKDYEELEKICPSNSTLSKVLNDYYEMQKSAPSTLLEQLSDFWGTYMVPIVTTIIAGIVVLMVRRYISRTKKQDRKRGKLILSDLKSWIEKTTFANITYYKGLIRTINHKDPELDYLDEDIKILKKYNAYVLWEEGKRISESLKKDGVKALRKFHSIIEKALENIPLKKSLVIGTLSEPYYSFPRICETIFMGGKLALSIKLDQASEEISVERGNSKPQRVTGFLSSGAVTLAWGEVEILRRLEGIIEDLNENVRKEIDIYNECKRKLDSNKPFAEFERKITEIIAKFRWYQKF